MIKLVCRNLLRVHNFSCPPYCLSRRFYFSALKLSRLLLAVNMHWPDFFSHFICCLLDICQCVSSKSFQANLRKLTNWCRTPCSDFVADINLYECDISPSPRLHFWPCSNFKVCLKLFTSLTSTLDTTPSPKLDRHNTRNIAFKQKPIARGSNCW